MCAENLAVAIAEAREEIGRVCNDIYEHPELGYNEHRACSLLSDFLRRIGFAVESGVGGVETAFRAVHGNGGPRIAVLAEYDALPGIGHACGHHLISSAAMAAAVGCMRMMRERQGEGTLLIMGSPAEEGLGGKVEMIKRGLFDDVDCALICHPYSATLPDQGALAVSRFDLEFFGVPAHAATAPHKGKNALDAMTLFLSGVNAWRQHLPDTSRVHGVITDGGSVPNIIPAHTKAQFYIRALTVDVQLEMEERFAKIAEGAALMTETTFKLNQQDNPYMPIRKNPALNDFFVSHAPHFGLELSDHNPQGMISTDFGNVSQLMPGANWFFQITDDGAPLHTEEFKRAAGSPFAFAQSLKIGALMAAAAFKAMSEPQFMKTLKEDFLKEP